MQTHENPSTERFTKPQSAHFQPQLAENTDQTMDEAVDRGAVLLRDTAAAVFLYGASQNNVLGALPLGSFTKYIEQISKDTLHGVEDVNPLTRMLVEHAALMHHSIAQLYSDAAQQSDCQKKRSFFELATRLTGEFRRVIGEILAQCEAAKKQSAGAGS